MLKILLRWADGAEFETEVPSNSVRLWDIPKVMAANDLVAIEVSSL